jgi:vacuolar-type H+-ATPase subunit F/Vma7
MYPGNVKFMREAYDDATKEPFGYIFIDLKPATEEQLRLRTHIFPEEYPTVVYIPKSVSKRK